MEYREHLAAVEREAAVLTTALGAGAADRPVPTCPGWTTWDLADHVGRFCTYWSDALAEPGSRPERRQEEPPGRPGDADGPAGTGPAALADWFGQRAARLLDLLGSTDADAAVWTWHDTDHTAGFVARRCAHELAVHRYDAQCATTVAAPIDGALAVDGIDEVFAMLAAWWRLGWAAKGAGESLHLHASAPDAEWTVTLTDDGPAVERAHRKAGLALRGGASDLELLLYGRPPLGTVERLGDERALAAWYRVFRF